MRALGIASSWDHSSTQRLSPWDSLLLLIPLGEWFPQPCGADVAISSPGPCRRSSPGLYQKHFAHSRQMKAKQFGCYPPASRVICRPGVPSSPASTAQRRSREWHYTRPPRYGSKHCYEAKYKELPGLSLQQQTTISLHPQGLMGSELVP